MAADSMTRLESGLYYLEAGGCEYHVRKEVTRVATGRTSKGRANTAWKVFRGETLISESPTYGDAKAVVWEDSEKTPEERGEAYPDEDSASAGGESMTDDGWEYPDGRGETPIGPPTNMELHSV